MQPTQHESPPWSLTVKIIVAVIALLLGTLVIWRFQTLISPVIIACILAYLLSPLVSLTMQHLKLNRGTAVLLVYLLLLLAGIGGGIGLGILAFEQVSKLLDLLPNNFEDAAAQLQAQVESWLAWEIPIAGFLLSPKALTAGIDFSALTQQAITLIRPIFSQGGTLAAQLAQATISTLSVGFLILVISIYMAKDAPKFWQTVSDLAHQPGYRMDAERLMHEFARIWHAYLRGQVILALVIGVIVSITLSLLGVTSALGLGVLSGVMEFLPIIGPLIGAGAAIVVALFQSETIWGLSHLQYALVVTGLMVVIQALENNILVPRIVGDALDLHPLLVMISVVMGASLAGVLGAVLAAPVVATLKLLGAYAWRKMLDLPPFPAPEPSRRYEQLSWITRAQLAWRQWTRPRGVQPKAEAKAPVPTLSEPPQGKADNRKSGQRTKRPGAK